MTLPANSTPSDRALRESVLDAIAGNHRGRSDVDVVVRDRTVTVCGSVRSFADRDRVLAAALTAPGVHVIVDDTAVRTLLGTGSSDATIAARVGELIATLPSVHVDGIRVHVRRGVVTVGGAVPWQFERDTLLNLIGAVPGVEDLVDVVTLRRSDQGAGEHDRQADDQAPAVRVLLETID